MVVLPPDFEQRLVAHRAVDSVQPPTRRAAVAVILRASPAGRDLLLMRRVLHERDPWSGHVSLPGGTQERDDADLLGTALRETREEVGVDLGEQGSLLCRLGPVPAIGRGRRLPMDITPFVFRLEQQVVPVIGQEAEAVFWLPLERAVAGEFDGWHTWRDGPLQRRLPCWTYEGHVVWGLTYTMIQQVLLAAGVGDSL